MYSDIQPLKAVWLSARLFASLEGEADRIAPLETGGLLMGFVDRDMARITDAVGPGPNAIHRRNGFLPDATYHENEVARIYRTSGRLHTYLGDWHTHPGGQPALSRVDRRTMRKIARSAEARAPSPLMLVASGGPIWQLTAWQLVIDGLRRRAVRVETHVEE